ncbi:porin [Alsobacter sp. SYSU BS001988]
MRFSNLLLGSAAVLATGSAYAADLPSKKSAPVEYVRVCSAQGAGFFYIPGTDTCIRIGGRARFDYGYGQPFTRGDNVTGMKSLGRIQADVRNATEYGLLRAYVRLQLGRGNGALASGTGNGTAIVGSAVPSTSTSIELDRAYVQFGGLTAGRTQSFFDFYAGDLEVIGTTAGDGSAHNMLAYSASFGKGFSATIALEDPIESRSGVTVVTGPSIGKYAGAGAPDVVANLRVEQGWGAAQLSGAIHQVRVVNTTAAIGGFAPSADYGFAVNGGVQFNLPFAAGDQLWLQGTYTKGNPSRVTGNGISTGVGAIGFGLPDAFSTANGGTGKLDLVTAWGVTAAAIHNWTPTVSTSVFGSYAKVDVGGATFTAAGGAIGTNSVRDFTYWTVGGNVAWSPVKDFVIAAEVDYLRVEGSKGGVFSGLSNSPRVLVKSDDAIISRLRFQRDF